MKDFNYQSEGFFSHTNKYKIKSSKKMEKKNKCLISIIAFFVRGRGTSPLSFFGNRKKCLNFGKKYSVWNMD